MSNFNAIVTNLCQDSGRIGRNHFSFGGSLQGIWRHYTIALFGFIASENTGMVRGLFSFHLDIRIFLDWVLMWRYCRAQTNRIAGCRLNFSRTSYRLSANACRARESNRHSSERNCSLIIHTTKLFSFMMVII